MVCCQLSLWPLLLLLITGSSGLNIFGLKFESLHVRFDFNRSNGFYKMPLSTYEIKLQRHPEFVLSGRDFELNADIYCYPGDPRVCLLFDSHGIIAGIRLGYIIKDIDALAQANKVPFEYNGYKDISMFQEETFLGEKIYSAKVLFYCPKKIKSGGRKYLKGAVEEGIYVKLEGKWKKITTKECDAVKLGFTKQSCMEAMGQHYFYKMTPSLDCKKFEPIFLLYEFGELVGFGLTPLGWYTSKKGGRVWFEPLNEQVAKVIVPYGPQCAFDWIRQYGGTSLHVYFNLFPTLTKCPPKEYETKCPGS